MTYRVSDEELGCMLKEVRNTSPSVSTFTMSLRQARALIEEASRGRARTLDKNRQIDVFDLSAGTMAVWGGEDDTE